MSKAQSRRPAATPAVETLEAELGRIAALGLDDLRSLWLKMTGQGAPRALSRDLLADGYAAYKKVAAATSSNETF